jgi:hypothetical protein
VGLLSIFAEVKAFTWVSLGAAVAGGQRRLGACAETRCWMQLVDDGSHLAAPSGRFNRRSTTGRKGEQMYFGFISASWINQIERFFGLRQRTKFAAASSNRFDDLKQAITRFIDAHNQVPKPFQWIKSADDILTNIRRFCELR